MYLLGSCYLILFQTQKGPKALTFVAFCQKEDPDGLCFVGHVNERKIIGNKIYNFSEETGTAEKGQRKQERERN